jgi:hypothetical protein
MIASPRQELDEVIDRVAAKMVAIEDDGALMARVMAQLPERVATPWFMSTRVQLAAAAALVLVAFLYARPAREVTPREASHVPVAAPTVDSKPVAPLGTLALVKPSFRPVVPDPRSPIQEDHERSLAPVAAIGALELDGIAPSTLELDAPASLEPLVLTELALGNKGDR